MADTVEIPIEALDQFSQVFAGLDENFAVLINQNQQLIDKQKQSTQSTKENTLSWTDFRSAYSTVLDAVRAGQQVWDGTVGELDRYAASVEKVSRLTGQSAEESSRLIQVADDLQVSQESLNSALTIAAKKHDVSIEGLAKLSDQYNSFTNAQDKAAFAAQIFGRNYTEVVKILEAGGTQLRAMGGNVEGGLIINEAQIEQIHAYRREIDAAADSFEALKLQVGGTLLTSFNQNAVAMHTQNVLMEQGNQVIAAKIRAHTKLTDAEQATYDAAQKTAEATYYQTQNMKDATDAGNAMAESIDEITTRNKDLLGEMKDFQGIADNYSNKTQDLGKQEQDLLEKKKELIKEGYSPEGKNVQEINDKLKENAQAQEDAAKAAQKAVKDRVVAMLTEKLAANGLTDSEFNALIDLQQQWGLLDSQTAASAKNVNDAVNQYLTTGNIDQFKSAIDDTTKALLNLPATKTLELNVNVNMTGPLSPQGLQGLLSAIT